MITLILFWAILGGLVLIFLDHHFDDSPLGWALTILSILVWPYVLLEKQYRGRPK